MLVRRIISLITLIALVVATAAPLAAQPHRCADALGGTSASASITTGTMDGCAIPGCCGGTCTCNHRAASRRATNLPAGLPQILAPSATPGAPALAARDMEVRGRTVCCGDHGTHAVPDHVAAISLPTQKLVFPSKAPALFGCVPGCRSAADANPPGEIDRGHPPHLSARSHITYLRLGILLI